MSPDNREPDAGGEPHIYSPGIRGIDPAPADGAGLTDEEIEAIILQWAIDYPEGGDATGLDTPLVAAATEKAERFWKPKVAEAEADRDHWESNVAKAVDELEAAQTVSTEFLQSRVACLKRLEAALEDSKQLREALEAIVALGHSKITLPYFAIAEAALAHKEAQDAGS